MAAGDKSRNKETQVRLDEGGDPNLLPSGERDFGDSAGYGTGGSARDYHEVTGEDPVDLPKSNPLDKVVKPKRGS